MRINLPVYDEIKDIDRGDALLRRDGVFVPLKLAFDPHDVSATEAPAPSPSSGFAEAEARLGVQALLTIERVDKVHARVAPMAEAVARADASYGKLSSGRLVGPDREATLRDLPPLPDDEAYRRRLTAGLDAALERDRALFELLKEKTA